MPTIDRAERHYAVMRTIFVACVALGVVMITAVFIYFLSEIRKVQEDQQRFLCTGSIPAQESVMLHRANQERLDALIRQHGGTPPPPTTPKFTKCPGEDE